MKKNRFTEFFKGKGYYVLLFVGVLAIAAVAYVGSRLTSRENEEENRVDLNEQDNNIAADDDSNLSAENNPQSDGIVNNEQGDNLQNDITNDHASNDSTISNDDLLEYAEYPVEDEQEIDTAEDDAADAEVAQNDTTDEEEGAPEAVETTGKTVKAENTPVQLHFNVDEGLLWPVDGNVIMNYSMDHTIYHATLMQFRCNPAIIIDAEVGTEVKAAIKGIVTSIVEDEKTGLTVTADIGDGYSLVYGQLENVDLEVGDKLDEGEVVGTIAQPSKYYCVEGSNLYFQVLQNGNTVNPMLYLR